jgi:hypothetical protein
MLNDDYTPMEFVIYVLERFFNKSREAATEIMLHVHHRGVGVCGVYTYEVAETKVAQVIDFARRTSTRCNARWKRRRQAELVPMTAHRQSLSRPMLSPNRRDPAPRPPSRASAGMSMRRWSTCCWP